MILCPKCDSSSGVTQTRDHGRTALRRRKCKRCGYNWTTLEVTYFEAEYLNALREWFEQQPKEKTNDPS